MLKHVRGWLGNIPINTPLERRQAGLFQIFLLIILGNGHLRSEISYER